MLAQRRRPPEGEQYRRFSDTSCSEGVRISQAEFRELVGSRSNRARYKLLVVETEAATRIFVDGNEALKPPGNIPCAILIYSLRHDGCAGTSLNLAYRVVQSPWLRRLPKDLAERVIGASGICDDLDCEQRRVAQRIFTLNRYLEEIGLESRLRADPQLKEYRLIPKPRYCLVAQTET